jgi:hypothetical protein
MVVPNEQMSDRKTDDDDTDIVNYLQKFDKRNIFARKYDQWIKNGREDTPYEKLYSKVAYNESTETYDYADIAHYIHTKGIS